MKPKDILNLAAPQTWAGSIAPATVGLAVSYHVQGHLDLMMAVCFYLIVLLMQSAVNAFDDYADFVKGTDTLENSPDAEDAVIVYRHNGDFVWDGDVGLGGDTQNVDGPFVVCDHEAARFRQLCKKGVKSVVHAKLKCVDQKAVLGQHLAERDESVFAPSRA